MEIATGFQARRTGALHQAQARCNPPRLALEAIASEAHYAEVSNPPMGQVCRYFIPWRRGLGRRDSN